MTQDNDTDDDVEHCPKCDSFWVMGDGDSSECFDCGYSWGVVGGRGATNFGDESTFDK